MNKIFSAALSVALICTTSLHAQTINTIAGTGTTTYNGDNIPATAANLNFPSGTAVDASGNVYIADYLNSRIRMIDGAGIMHTIAGTGTVGYNGDNIAATSAELNEPWALAVDAIGNLYIADGGNHRLRMVDTAGIITTLAGNDTAGYSGDGGPATAAKLYSPNGIAVDGLGNIYITDQGTFTLRMINAAGTISTLAGNGTPGFSGDGGPATSALLGRVSGVATDAAGNIYIADNGSRVRKINTSGIINTIAGNGIGGYNGDGIPATSATISGAVGLALDASGNVYIADAQNSRIRRVSANDTITTVVGTGVPGYSGDGGLPASAQLYLCTGISIDPLGNLYVSDYANHRVRKVDYSTGIHNFQSPAGDLKIFPNANNGSFTISGPLLIKSPTVQITISDLTGKIVQNDEANVQNGHIDKQVKLSSTAPAGNYLLTITTDQGTATLKFEKK